MGFPSASSGGDGPGFSPRNDSSWRVAVLVICLQAADEVTVVENGRCCASAGESSVVVTLSVDDDVYCLWTVTATVIWKVIMIVSVSYIFFHRVARLYFGFCFLGVRVFAHVCGRCSRRVTCARGLCHCSAGAISLEYSWNAACHDRDRRRHPSRCTFSFGWGYGGSVRGLPCFPELSQHLSTNSLNHIDLFRGFQMEPCKTPIRKHPNEAFDVQAWRQASTQAGASAAVAVEYICHDLRRCHGAADKPWKGHTTRPLTTSRQTGNTHERIPSRNSQMARKRRTDHVQVVVGFECRLART